MSLSVRPFLVSWYQSKEAVMQTNITGFAVQGNLGVIRLATSGQDTFGYVGSGT
jgi:hypothetical protein